MFRQLGFRLRKPRPALASADPVVQKAHKKIQDLMQDDSVDLWATDESALSAARLALPQVDPARNQGPCPTACSHPQERGVFRGRALAGWALCVPSGNRQIQWRQLPSVSPATPLRQPGDPETGCGHLRQCPVSPLPPAPTVAGPTRPRLCFGLPSPVQSRTQSDRASVEAHTPSLPAQSLLRKSARRHQCS